VQFRPVEEITKGGVSRVGSLTGGEGAGPKRRTYGRERHHFRETTLKTGGTVHDKVLRGVTAVFQKNKKIGLGVNPVSDPCGQGRLKGGANIEKKGNNS